MSPASGAAAFLEARFEEIRERPLSKEEIHRRKVVLARRFSLPRLPSDAELVSRLSRGARPSHDEVPRVKPARTASGVAVVTVMTAPHACPHGVCVYCPGGPRLGTPQSYTGEEAAAKRAATHAYEPRAQTEARLRVPRSMGHPTDKGDPIIPRGTVTSLMQGHPR